MGGPQRTIGGPPADGEFPSCSSSFLEERVAQASERRIRPARQDRDRYERSIGAGRDVSRDKPPPRLLVAREEEAQHPRRDCAAFEIVVGREKDEGIGTTPPALAPGSASCVLYDGAGPCEHPQVIVVDLFVTNRVIS